MSKDMLIEKVLMTALVSTLTMMALLMMSPMLVLFYALWLSKPFIAAFFVAIVVAAACATWRLA